MKKNLLPLVSALLLVFISPLMGVGQVFWTEDFETDGAGVRYTLDAVDDEFNDGSSDHYGRTDGLGISGSYSGQNGIFFWAGEDIDDNGGNGNNPKAVIFNSQSIAGMTDVRISGLFARGSAGGGGIDQADYLRLDYRIDGGSWTPAIWFSGQSGSNNGAYLDTDYDGTGDGTALTNTFASFTKDISVSGSNIELRVEMSMNSGSEEVAYDYLQLENTNPVVGGNDITVTQSTGGTITPGTTAVAEGADQDFTATADACYTFTNWVVDGSPAGNSNPYSFTNVTAPHTITAVYTSVASSNIVASAGANGNISPSGTTSVSCGGSQSYTITPDVGYGVLDVLVDGVSVGAVTSYDFTNVTTGHTISATFAEAPCASVDFTGSGNSGSYLTLNWTDNSVDWTATDARGDQDLNGSEAVTLRNGSLTNDASVAGGCGTLSFDYARAFTGNSTLQVFVNGTQYGGDITVSNTSSTTFSVVVNQTGNIDIELRNSGNRTVINNLQWSCYSPAFPPVDLSVSASAGTEAGATAITVTATASFAVTGAQTVDLAVTGTNITAGDYTLSGTTITIADGATTGTVTFTVVDDALTETAETATLTISNPSGGVTIGSTATQDIDITDNDAPVIVAAPTSLTGFSTPQGTPSASQTFTLEGDNLSGDLSIAALTGFEYSLDNTTFTSTLTVPVSGGNVTGEPRTIYVRLTGAIIGTPSGNAVISGGGATSVNVALDGAVTTPPAAPCSDLFISEYVEGSSNNKYIEIYNPTASAIDLGTGNYSLRSYANGSSTPANNALSGTIPAFGTVVYKNSSATIYSGTATDNNSVNFNGDDAVALAKAGTNIDIFGNIGNDPGSQWSLSGNNTQNQTLVRNPAVQIGIDADPTGTGAASFTTLGTEWTEFAIDNIADLGSHTCDCFVALPSVTLTSNTTAGTEAGTTAITLTATADVAVTGSQTVVVALSGTGLASTDFTGVNFLSTVNITIADGATVGTITFNVADDSDVEGSETATFTIGSPSAGIVVGTPNAVDLTIADDDNLTSTESVIIEQSGEATGISSVVNGTINNNTDGTEVWSFNLYDGDGSSNDADNKPTIYEGFTIRQSGGNTVPAWDDAISNVKFFLGASATPISGSFLVSASTITFTPTTSITVTDGTTPAVISMRMTLDATLPAGSDGQHFGFSLDAADVTTETNVLLASQLGTFTELSDVALNGIDIVATLQFIDAPAAISIGSNFSVTVSAVDANGNVDTGISNSITLSLTSGSGTLSGAPTTANLSSGTHTFTGLSHDTEELIEITANDNGSVFADLTANINVTDEPNQLFDDFNRANNNTVGIPSSGGSTSWTEDGLFSNEAQRVAIDGNELYLGGCVAGTSSGSSGSTGMEQIRFNGETLYETIFDNAGGSLEWLFNMKQTRTNPSGFGGGTYAAAVVLGSDENDFESVNADGYAVIIGNGSTPDPVKLIRFAGGLSTNVNVTDVAVSTEIDADAYYSVKVTYDPCTGEWNLFVRDDGTSAFAAPNVGSLGTPVSATNQTHTGLDLKYFGAGWQHSSSCGEYLRVDNLNIPNATTASTTAKLWNGSVNADWNEANNWGPCPGVPTNTNDVIIPNVATQPVISAAAPAATCQNLTLNAGADLTINANRFLNVWGNVVNNGGAAFGDGTLSMEGPSTLTLTGNVNVANYHVSTTVTLNGTVTVSDIARSEVGGALAANGNLVLENGAQLLHGTGTTFGGGTVTGNIVVRRQGNVSGGFNGWSTPVVGGGLPGSSGYLYNSLLGTNSGTDDNNPDPDPGWVAHSGTMSAGKGYFSTNGASATFTGVANNGNYTPSVTSSTELMTSTDAPSVFNLIGNPYPSSLDADQFIADNSSNIDGALYFWSDENAGSAAFSTDDYATFTGGGSIVPISSGGSGITPVSSVPSCQGFFVNCETSGTIDFNNGQRGGSNGQFFRMAAQNGQRMWLSINNDNLELFNQTLVAFDEFATDQKDWGVDAYKFRGNPAISIGAQQNDETYVIATYEAIPHTGKVIPLMTFVETADTYTFVADSMEGFDNQNVFLEDLSNGSLYPMQQGDSHSFAMTSADEFNRFQLWFSPVSGTGVNESDNGFRLYANPNNTIVVETTSGDNMNGTVEITDMAGRKVLTNDISITNGIGRLQTADFANGVYAITFVSADGNNRTSQKVALGQ